MAFSHFTQQNGESHSYMNQEIPFSLKSNANPQAIKTRNRIFQVSSSSSSQNSGGVILFNIPPSNYSITKGSMALRLKITVTGTSLSGVSAATSVALDGPGPVRTDISGAGPLVGNGYSVIQRATLYGSNSAIIAQHNFLNDEMNLMLMHNSNSAYLTTDAQLLLGCGAQFNYSSSTSAFIDLVLPMPFSIFQSSTQDFPAYLLSAPLTIQLDLASTARAIFTGATVSDYTVSNAFLVYQAVELPNEMIQAERMAVKSSPFIMTCSNTMSVQVPNSVLTSYTLGLNASSIRGVAILPLNSASYTSATQIQYLRSTADAANTVAGDGAGAGVSNQIYLDGNLINSNQVDNVANTFAMLKMFLHHSLQGNILHPSLITAVTSDTGGPVANVNGNTGRNTYCQQQYAIGFDLSSFDEESTIFGGLPATNVNIQLGGYTNPTFLATIMIFYDVLVAFGEDGVISVKR